MPHGTSAEVQSFQNDPDVTSRIGGWLFRRRTLMPLPLAAAVLLLRVGEAPPSRPLVWLGVAVSFAGEIVRVWGVHHIGVISRTRSDRLGPLVASGPFAVVRNPLYLGNMALWSGFALTARLVWLAPAIVAVLWLEYHAIVRWEEQLLEARLGEAYRQYASRVPRWVPNVMRGGHGGTLHRDGEALHHGGHGGHGGEVIAASRFTWRDTLFSERGTLIAIALGYLLLWMKLKS